MTTSAVIVSSTEEISDLYSFRLRYSPVSPLNVTLLCVMQGVFCVTELVFATRRQLKVEAVSSKRA